jgi:hypothetical protein
MTEEPLPEAPNCPRPGAIGRNKVVGSTKQGDVMDFYGLPPIGQKRPMDGAQFHSRGPAKLVGD